MPENIYLERGAKKVFACSYGWPGWCRSGKTAEAAIEALAAHGARYALVARLAGCTFPTEFDFRVIDQVEGGSGTDFGVPSVVTPADHTPPTKSEAGRLVFVVEAAWAVFDEVAAASPESLRKGPRGGGRDRSKIVAHVWESDAAYAREIGVRFRPAQDAEAMMTGRRFVLSALARPGEGARWPIPYAARRIAWHSLDHSWEIEDRAG